MCVCVWGGGGGGGGGVLRETTVCELRDAVHLFRAMHDLAQSEDCVA